MLFFLLIAPWQVLIGGKRLAPGLNASQEDSIKLFFLLLLTFHLRVYIFSSWESLLPLNIPDVLDDKLNVFGVIGY